MPRLLCAFALVALLFVTPRSAAASIGTMVSLGDDRWLPLQIERVEVDVTIVGRLATTEVRQVFRSHASRRVEGRYSITVPETAAISRLAMSVGPQLVEGELVERGRARRVYEGIVRSMRDPALLEWQGPGSFQLRIFPIEPHGAKEVVLVYEDVLPVEDGNVVYRFDPVRGLGEDQHPFIGQFRFEVHGDQVAIAGVREPSFARRNYRPSAPIVVRSPISPEEVFVAAGADGDEFFADVALDLPIDRSDEPRGLVVAVDTSAAGGWERLEFVRAVASLLEEQHPERPLRIVYGAIDMTECEPAPVGLCFDRMELRGATDLGALLESAVGVAAKMGAADVAIFTDGIPTFGVRDLGALSNIVAAAAPNVALHAVAVGSANLDVLRELSEAGRGHLVNHTSAEVASRLLNDAIQQRRTWRVSAKALGGAKKLVPMGPRWIGPAGRFAVFGRATKRVAKIEVTARSGREVVRRIIDVGRSSGRDAPLQLIERAMARTRIRDLERRGASEDKIVALSQQTGVLSRLTSYLVLENEASFRKHAIERRKHAMRQAPAIVMSRPIVRGCLDKDLIRRVIRQRRRQIRSCYQAALGRDRHAHGKVITEFAVEHGRVTRTSIFSDEIDDGPLQDCVLDALRSLEFPTVADGGLVTVRYPFDFQPEEKPAAAWPLTPSQVVADHIQDGDIDGANALVQAHMEALAHDVSRSGAVRRLDLFDVGLVREVFEAEFIAAATARLRHANAPRGLHASLAERLLRNGAVAELAVLPPPEARNTRYLLARAVDRLTVDGLRKLGVAWLAGLTPQQVVSAIHGSPALETLFVDHLGAALSEVDAPDDNVIEALVRAASGAGRPDVAVSVVTDRCEGTVPEKACILWLRRLGPGQAISGLLARHFRFRVAALEAARRHVPGDVALLGELAGYLAESGQRRRAEATLSEIVEFRPASSDAQSLMDAALRTLPE